MLCRMFDYFNLNPDFFGLDISDLSLKIAKLKKSRGLILSSFGEKQIPKGIVESGEIKNEVALVKIIKEGIKGVEGEKLQTKYAACSLPEEKSYLQVIQIPKMQEEEIGNAVRFEAENYIPLPIDDVYLDFQVIKPYIDNSDHLDILISAIPKNIADSYVSVLNRAGILPLAMEVEGLSIARALIKEERAPYPVLLIDCGATMTSFIIFSGSSIRFTSSIPASSDDLTLAIAAAMKTSMEKAEEAKKKYGILGLQKIFLKEKTGDFKFEKEILSDKKFFEIIKPALDDLVEKIKEHINYYQMHFTNGHLPSNARNIEKILLCGGGANLKGFCEFLTKELKIKTELGDPRTNIPKSISSLSFETSLSFSTAIGLALRKIEI